MKTFIRNIIKAISILTQKNRNTSSDNITDFKKVVESSQYFDPEWYLNRNPDVRKAKMNPAEHYLL